MNIKRPLTDEELKIAFIKLDQEIKKINENHSEYFRDEKNPKSIDYIQASGQTDWTGFTIYNIPFIAFMDNSLSEDIKIEVRQKFIEIVTEIIKP